MPFVCIFLFISVCKVLNFLSEGLDCPKDCFHGHHSFSVYFIPGGGGIILGIYIPYPRVNCLKTIPFTAYYLNAEVVPFE